VPETEHPSREGCGYERAAWARATRSSLRGGTGFLLAIFADWRSRGRRHGRRTLPLARRRILPAGLGTCALVACFLTACERGDPAPDRAAAGADTTRETTAVRVVDDAGRTVELPRPARRVIALIPAQTEVIKLLAGRDAVIARTQWDDDPELAHLPSVGNALLPSVEWLAAQRPDLVIAWRDVGTRDVVQRLSDIGIPVYSSSVESVADIRDMIVRLGVLVDEPERAAALVASIDATLDSVRTAVAQLPRQRVLYLLSPDPATAAGPGTYLHELLELAGGDNIFADARQLWPQVSLEEVIRRDPDVIIRPTERDTSLVAAELRARAGWRELRAVRAGRVYAVDADLFNRAGVSIGRVAAELAARIHAQSQ
jgi:iron complex transport system substrate-binding protein